MRRTGSRSATAAAQQEGGEIAILEPLGFSLAFCTCGCALEQTDIYSDFRSETPSYLKSLSGRRLLIAYRTARERFREGREERVGGHVLMLSSYV